MKPVLTSLGVHPITKPALKPITVIPNKYPDRMHRIPGRPLSIFENDDPRCDDGWLGSEDEDDFGSLSDYGDR